MSRFINRWVLVTVAIFLWPACLLAEYTLVLKNNRRITVQEFREEGGLIKFYALGGEISIPRDQIQSILKAEEGEGHGLVLSGAEGSQAEATKKSQPPAGERMMEEGGKAASETPEKTPAAEETPADEKAKEESEYQRRVREITEQIKATRERYSLSSGGSGGSDPTLLNSEEAIRARTDDLTSRLRDAQHNPAGPSDAGGVKLSTPSPFTGTPPGTLELRPGEVIPRVDSPAPTYSKNERELSELRNRLNQLVKARERLIGEMKQKNFETGNLFLE